MKKIYYFPGLISALIIPVLFWYYGNQKFEEINISAIDIGLPAKHREGQNYSFGSFEPLRNWDYKTIKVEANKAKENSNFYVLEIKNLQKRNEKETGIEFILDKNNTYGDFVSLLNDMHIAKQDSYVLDIEKTGNFFVPVNYISPHAKMLKYECLFCNDVIRDEYRPTFFEKTQQYLISLPKEAYYIIFGFLLLLNFSIFSIKERFQLQRFHY